MRNNASFITRKVFNCLIAFIMAGCIAISFSAGLSSGLLCSQEFVQERMEQNNEMLLAEVDKKIQEVVAPQTKIPTKAFTSAVREGHIKTVLDQVSGNLVYGFKTDFSTSKYLYSYYRTGIINFCENNGVVLTEDEINRNACLAVDTFNQVCGDESTNFIIPFQEAQSQDPLNAILICMVVFILCYLILGFINYGGPIKYAYVGMSIMCAGVAMVVLSGFALLMNYSALFDFTDVDAFDLGISMVIDDVIRYMMAVGGVILLVGIVFMQVVYRILKRNAIAVQTEIDINQKLIHEFEQEVMLVEQEQEQKIQQEIELKVKRMMEESSASAENEELVQEVQEQTQTQTQTPVSEAVEELVEEIAEEYAQEIAQEIAQESESTVDEISEDIINDISKEIIDRKVRLDLEQEYQRKIKELSKNTTKKPDIK